ncbi:hypothetical protein AKO1_006448, partial [Acrasis kona]
MNHSWEDPLTIAMWSPDAFLDDWKTIQGSAEVNNNFCVPPLPLIMRSVMYAIKMKSIGTLIVPKWPSAPWWVPLMVIGQSWLDVSNLIDSHLESEICKNQAWSDWIAVKFDGRKYYEQQWNQ